MRLNGEIHGENGEDEEEQNYHPQKLVVGYALTSKKKKSFLQPKLLALARSKGIFFVAIDLNRPLTEQGPFDILLHKEMNGATLLRVLPSLLIMNLDQIVEINPQVLNE
ncbi:hypothetical protein TIFTF001_021563 [Ficus carica]|uniref:Inositol-tetrakisphosphate 1-kinase N-terminal domain-containing protein n=1 Tax=Ficus carica TaxID=3494 RepID=A0AA88AHQ0_FICCA|nr:hypothetical protein TIFTF001_021563 [Ficus carica]